MCKTTDLSVYSITPEFESLKDQLIVLMIMINEQDLNTLAIFLHENNTLKRLGFYIDKPEDLCEQSLQTVADSLKHNSTLEQLRIAGPFPEEKYHVINQRIEVVKWKVKITRQLTEVTEVDIDFK